MRTAKLCTWSLINSYNIYDNLDLKSTLTSGKLKYFWIFTAYCLIKYFVN